MLKSFNIHCLALYFLLILLLGGLSSAIICADTGTAQDMRLEKLVADVATERETASQLRQQLADVQYLIRLAALKGTPEETVTNLFKAQQKARAGIENQQNKRLAELRARLQDEIQQIKETLIGIPQAAEFVVIRQLQDADTFIAEIQAETIEDNFKKQLLEIQKRLANTSPPESFPVLDGIINMRLVQSGRGSFYISSEPVSKAAYALFEGGKNQPAAADQDQPAVMLSYQDALAFCKWLRETTGDLYVIPSLPHLQKAKPESGVALWTSTVWKPENIATADVMQRFEVEKMTVLDKGRLLQKKETFGELPLAAYANLSFMIITAPRTGIEHFLNSIRRTLDDDK